MQIVIDIDEDVKTRFCSGLEILSDASAVADALYKGTPLPKWIPCKERLPESDCETVLVSGKMKYASEKEYEYFTDCAFVGSIHGTPDNFSPFDFETWNDWYEGQDEYYILAWMPLPEPFKEENEEVK